ncbi:MAG: protein kinase, partial [Acidobacteriota bacterium]
GDALPIVVQMAQALAAAHRQGVVHRDFKPSNIMLDDSSGPSLRAVVTDFGLARQACPSEDDALSSLTETGKLFGTPAYMAPEQLRGKEATTASDVYALGLVAFEMITGVRPFQGDSPLDSAMRKLEGPVPSLRACTLDLDPAWETALARCLEPDPSKRFEKPAQFLEGLLDKEPSQRPSRVERSAGSPQALEAAAAKTPPPAGRRWARLAALIILGAALLASALIAFLPRLPDLDRTRPAPEPAGRLTALVTWPSNERISRISPNRRLLSFVSDRDGMDRLYLLRLPQEESGAGTPFEIASPQQPILDTLWSPDSDRIALLLRRDDTPVLHIIQAASGRATQPSQVLRINDYSPQMVRWIGSSLYLESSPQTGGSFTIGRFDIETRTWQDAAFTAPGFDSVRDFDLSADGQRVLFSASREGQTDLWLADFEDIEGRSFKQLTDDSYVDSKPRWFGAADSSIVYESNRSGQIDLWKMDLPGLALPLHWRLSTQQITFSPSEVLLEDVAEDGSLLTFQIIEEKADLLSLNPRSGKEIQVTADSLNDFFPSLSQEPKRLVFQRSRSSIQSYHNFIGNQVFDAKILLARSDGSTSTIIIDQGFAARLSPNAQWIAYLQTPPRDGHDPPRSGAAWRSCKPLWVQGLGNRQGPNLLLNNCYLLSGLIPFPLNWVADNMVWSGDGHDLFFVSLSKEGRYRIKRCRPGSTQPCQAVVQASDTRQQLADLHLSPDDRKLAYLSRTGDAGKWDVRTLDLESEEDLPLHFAQGRTLTLEGWTADGKGVLLLRSSPEGGPVSVEIVKVHLDGREEFSGIVDNVDRYAGGFDPVTGNLYLIQAEDGIRNIVAFSLATRRLTQLTGNSQANVAFSGLEISDGGELFFSRHSKNRDIWMFQFRRPK